jgi:hypothetical protein
MLENFKNISQLPPAGSVKSSDLAILWQVQPGRVDGKTYSVAVGNLIAAALQAETVQWRGPWSSTTRYDLYQVVTYEGSAYISLTTNLNVIPSSAPSIWSVFASRGAAGSTSQLVPGGVSGQIQYNNAGNLAGSSLILLGATAQVATATPGISTLQIANTEFVSTAITNSQSTAASLYATLTALVTEASTRQAADNTLQANINAEASARLSADNAIVTSLALEVTDRLAADALLLPLAGGHLTGPLVLSASPTQNLEAATKIYVDNHTQDLSPYLKSSLAASVYATITELGTETTGRQAADTALQSNIDGEASARGTADIALRSALDTEISSRSTADTSLQNSLATETSARAAADLLLLPLAGGTLTGPLILARAPQSDLEAATRKYVMDSVASLGSNQSIIDLQNAVALKLDASIFNSTIANYVLSTGLTTALTPYLTASTAASTYLSQTNASSTYATTASLAPYALTSSLSVYLTSTTAASTYEPLLPSQVANAGKFLTTNGIVKSWVSIPASVAGSIGQVQYNNAGSLAGTTQLTVNSDGIGWGNNGLSRFTTDGENSNDIIFSYLNGSTPREVGRISSDTSNLNIYAQSQVVYFSKNIFTGNYEQAASFGTSSNYLSSALRVDNKSRYVPTLQLELVSDPLEQVLRIGNFFGYSFGGFDNRGCVQNCTLSVLTANSLSPVYGKGIQYFDDTTNKLMIGGATGFVSVLTSDDGYLLSSTAASTYASIGSLSSFLTTANAASSYLTQANAASTYATITNLNALSTSLSSYLASATAATTYATIASLATVASSLSAYLTTSSAASTYLTQGNAASTYVTQSSAASTYAAAASLSSYLTTSNAASTYLTQSTAASTYLTQTNASSTYATISSLSSYVLTSSLNAYAPLVSPALTGIPTVPTATAGTNTTQAASTAFVTTAVATKVSKNAFTVGNGSATSFICTHGLNTLDVVVQVYNNASPYTVDYPEITRTLNTVVVTFSYVPTSNQYRVVILS